MSDATDDPSAAGSSASAAASATAGIDEVRRFLAEQALVRDPAAASVVEFAGGVSAQVVDVTADGRSMVVKRSLPKLRVPSDWPAKLERAQTEVAAMRFLRPLTPKNVPGIVAADAGRCMFAMERAPHGWRTWKAHLLSGHIDPAVAGLLGWILGRWHDRTWLDAAVAARFDDHEAFDQLRLDPFYRTAATRLPDLAERLLWHLDEMARRRRCLVHGDYSPKNVLLGDDGLWVIDYEVAHFGDPVFDLAFMLHHLLLKGVHLPNDLGRLRECSSRFLAAYREEAVRQPIDEPYLAAHVACLALSRVHGKSSADYLTDADRRRTTALCRDVLIDPVRRVDDVWDQLDRLAHA